MAVQRLARLALWNSGQKWQGQGAQRPQLGRVAKFRMAREVNPREHENLLGLHDDRFDVHSSWYAGNVAVKSFVPDELFGTARD